MDDSVLKDLIDITASKHPAPTPTNSAIATTTSVGNTANTSASTAVANLPQTCRTKDIAKQSGKAAELGVVIARPPALPAPLPKVHTSQLAPAPLKEAGKSHAPSPVQKILRQKSPLDRVATDSPLALSPFGAVDSPLGLDGKFSTIANSPKLSHGNGSMPTDSASRDRLDSVDLTLSDDEFEAGRSH